MNAFSQLNGQASLPHGGRSGLSAGWSGEAFSQLNAFDFFGDSTQKTRPLWAWAFSQLNAPRDSALVFGRSPVFAAAPFSQLNGHAAQVPGGQASPRIGRVGSAFSQLNAFDFFEFLGKKTQSHQVRAFSQLNGRLSLSRGERGRSQADESAGAFSQLNAWAACGRAKHAAKHSTSAVTQGSRVFSQLNARGHAPLGQARKNVFARAAFSQLNALGLVASSTCCSAHRSRPNPVPHRPDFRGLKPRAYLHTTHEPRTTRGSVHLEPGIWRNRMK